MIYLPSNPIKKAIVLSLVALVTIAVVCCIGFGLWFCYHITRVKEVVSEVYHPAKIYKVSSVGVSYSNLSEELGGRGLLFSPNDYKPKYASGPIDFTYDVGGTSMEETYYLRDFQDHQVPGPASEVRRYGYYEGTYRLYDGRTVTLTTEKGLRVGEHGTNEDLRYEWVSVEPYRTALSLPVRVKWSVSNGKVTNFRYQEKEAVFDNR